jgi:hypothetical protein
MYKIFRNILGHVDAINDIHGASLPYDPITKTFDESNPLTISLRQYEAINGALDLSDHPVAPLTLEQAKIQKKQEIIAIASIKQEELVQGFAPPEQASWSRKVTEARAFLASGEIKDAPMLRTEAIAISGATKEAIILKHTQGLATKILQKSEEMYMDSATIAGKRTNLLGQIEVANTPQEIEKVTWS